MNPDITVIEDIRDSLQKYNEIGPILALKLLNQLNKTKLTKNVLQGTRITKTVVTLSKKLANSEDEDDVEVSEMASKLTCKWKRYFMKQQE